MIQSDDQSIAQAVRSELIEVRTTFQGLLASLTDEDFKRQSLNSGWTNGEILAHMLFGFIVLKALLPMARLWGRLPRGSSKPFAWLLNATTRPFNWVNALGARMQSRVFTYQKIGGFFDSVIDSLLRQVDSIRADEWRLGMYYPTRWDSNFDEFMTLEKLFHYPVIHFNFHLKQISH